MVLPCTLCLAGINAEMLQQAPTMLPPADHAAPEYACLDRSMCITVVHVHHSSCTLCRATVHASTAALRLDVVLRCLHHSNRGCATAAAVRGRAECELCCCLQLYTGMQNVRPFCAAGVSASVRFWGQSPCFDRIAAGSWALRAGLTQKPEAAVSSRRRACCITQVYNSWAATGCVLADLLSCIWRRYRQGMLLLDPCIYWRALSCIFARLSAASGLLHLVA